MLGIRDRHPERDSAYVPLRRTHIMLRRELALGTLADDTTFRGLTGRQPDFKRVANRDTTRIALRRRDAYPHPIRVHEHDDR